MQFNFHNDHGEELTGRLELPDRIPRAFAIFSHCFTCSKNAKAASRISKALSDPEDAEFVAATLAVWTDRYLS